MEPLRDNLASAAAYGIVGIGLLVVGFLALDLVTPGKLRTLVWIDRNRNAVRLVIGQVIGLSVVLLGGIYTSQGLYLWRGVGYTALYAVLAIAVMMWSFVLIDWLTPGKLGSVLLDDDDHPAGWISAAVFVGVGLIIGAALLF
ncbi:DUF350 domain-containing protein [Gordonia soli]|uniref:DUF350 domain-containing protein n=1 Tax=Gordonia soli TaxID=320799 RepID=UPI000590494F|nr:DUF350 domain-containing protein [Gordonia soli]